MSTAAVSRVHPSVLAKEDSVSRELRRHIAKADPALEQRCLSISYTLHVMSSISSSFRVYLDADPRPEFVTFDLRSEANWPDAVQRLQALARRHPAPDYAARDLRDSMASASL